MYLFLHFLLFKFISVTYNVLFGSEVEFRDSSVAYHTQCLPLAFKNPGDPFSWQSPLVGSDKNQMQLSFFVVFSLFYKVFHRL